MERIKKILGELEEQNNLRTLRTVATGGKYVIWQGREYINLSGNDYLGLASDLTLQREFFEGLQGGDRFLMSNSSSRLVTGNSPEYDALESSLARLYPGRAALVLGSGYQLNTGILPVLTRKGDLILADKFVHASIIDGLRLCECEWHRFNHNDMQHLESLLEKMRGSYDNVWVVTESVFSMDGDRAPIETLAALKERYDVKLYLDEAHAFGVFGPNGAGCAAAAGADGKVDVIAATFGKALASYGAFAIVEPTTKELLINKMRPLIYSTATPPINLLWTKFLIDRLPTFDARREHLGRLIAAIAPGNSEATQIVPVMAYTNEAAGKMSEGFREAGFWVTPIRYPTVPQGKARIRISLSASIEESDIKRFMEVWSCIG